MDKEKYIIPEKYKSAVPFWGPGLLEHESGRKLIEKENNSFNIAQSKYPKEIGEQLQYLYEEDGYLLGIHRTPEPIDTIINSYFKKGLENKKLEYDNTVSTYLYFPTLLKEILNCNNDWKKSKGCIIVKIPTTPGTPFYYETTKENIKKYYILPKYIYGYIRVENNKIIDLINNPNFNKDLSFETLLSDEYIDSKPKFRKN